MKKSFLIIFFLAAVLIFPFAINVDKAGAEAKVFPWIVQNVSASVVNTAQGNPDVLATRSVPLTPAYTATMIPRALGFVATKFDGLTGETRIATATTRPDFITIPSLTTGQNGDLGMASTEMITGDAYGGRFTGSAQMDGTFHAMKMKSDQALISQAAIYVPQKNC